MQAAGNKAWLLHTQAGQPFPLKKKSQAAVLPGLQPWRQGGMIIKRGNAEEIRVGVIASGQMQVALHTTYTGGSD